MFIFELMKFYILDFLKISLKVLQKINISVSSMLQIKKELLGILYKSCFWEFYILEDHHMIKFLSSKIFELQLILLIRVFCFNFMIYLLFKIDF